MEKVTSRDGTKIAYHRRGSGPPLILAHGIGAANPIAWTAVFPKLAQNFTVFALDRRGRGASGDSPMYAIEREYEDISAVAEAAGEPVNVLGHSFGGLLALEAALLTPKFRKLVLYEGAPTPNAPMFPDGFVERLQTKLDAGDREGALTAFYCEVAGMKSHEIEQMRTTSAWQARIASVHTLPREMMALTHYQFDPDRFKSLQTPTLLLYGGDSQPFIKAAMDALDAVLPDSRIVELAGQAHIAMYQAPKLFLREVLAFLKGSD